MEPCLYEGKISEIATNLLNLKEHFEEFKFNDFSEVKKALECISQKMNKPRLPMWVTWLLSLASGLIVGLSMALVKR